MQIVCATLTDWPAIEAIYRAGIRTGLATFNTEADVPDGLTWFEGKLDGFVFKAVEKQDNMLGWAALSPTSKRRVYRGVAEVSVYVALDAAGRGVGGALMAQLIEASEKAGIWTLTATIFPENEASVRLHSKFGFKMLGRRDRIAKLNGVWRDTVVMERRSDIV